MFVLRRAVPAGRHPARALSSTRLRPVGQALAGRASAAAGEQLDWLTDRAGRAEPQLVQRPAAVPLHRARAPASAAEAIHRFASRAIRRVRAWDCGFPDPSPVTQYTAGSFSQPIRRVFGTVRFRGARGGRRCRRRATPRPARLHVRAARPRSGTCSMRRSRGAVGFAADRLNHLQFLTIRRYLSLVFGALVVLLRCSRYGDDRSICSSSSGRCCWCWRSRRCSPGYVRKVKARLLRRQRAAAAAALPRSAAAAPQGGRAGGQRLLAVPRGALSDLRRDLGRGRARADLRHRPDVQLAGRPDRHRRAARQRRASCSRWPDSTSARASAASAPAAR